MITICGIICDEKVALEFEKRTFELNGRTVPLKTMEIYATSADYAERMPELQKEARKYYDQVAAEVKAIYAPDKSEKEVAKHPDFVGYIDDLKKVFEDACSKYDKIYDAVETARRIWKDAKSDLPEGNINLERHKLNYLEAEENFKENMTSLRADVDGKIKAIREQLQTHARAFYRADSSKLDNDTITLLESGILTDNELESLVRKFKNNVTMMRMVGRYAAMRNTDAMRSLTYKIEHLELDGQQEVNLFNEAVMYGNRCIDQKGRDFSDIGRKYFDQSVQKVIDEMNGFFVCPVA